MSSISAQQKPIILVDGSSYLFRAFHAMPPLTNSTGMPTGAIKGVINMLRSLENQYTGSDIFVVFDAKGPTFRHEQYPAYKANRPPMPDELRVQIAPIHAIIQAKGHPLICIEGVEADDVIGTLAQHATEKGIDCVISTGDKDMAQLVNAHITLVNTMSNEALDVAGVTAKYGFGPEYMIDYLGLMGDKSDNIPGVPGVGQKTATALIAGLGSLSNIYEHLDDVAGLTFRGAKTMAAKLIEHREQAFLSYQLATIKCDVALDTRLEDLTQTPPDNEALLALYTELEFRSWINDLNLNAPRSGTTATSDTGPDIDFDSRTYATGAPLQNASHGALPERTQPIGLDQDSRVSCVVSESGLQKVIDEMTAARTFAVFLVRAPGHYLQQRPMAIALACEQGNAYYIPFQCNDIEAPPLLDEYLCFSRLRPLLENYDVAKVGHDLKSLRHQLDHYGVEPAHFFDDIWLKAFVFDSALKRHAELDKSSAPLSIDNLLRQYCQWQPLTYTDVAGNPGTKQLLPADIPLDRISQWAGAQVDGILRINQWLSTNMPENSDLGRVYSGIEQPLIPVLQQVERQGTLLDVAYLNQLSQTFSERTAALEAAAYEEAGEPFNLSSPKQLGTILFEKMGLPALQKTATGQPSTNESVLSELALTYSLPRLILEHRHLSKLLGTYTLPLPKLVNSDTGRVHTSYNQAGAATGRFASNDPNLQNIPIRSLEGRAIRRAFVAPKGRKIVAADYSQIELRIMTHLSQDATLIKAFRAGQDIHRATAADVMGIAPEEVTTEQRRNAKAINFGLIYGMSAFGLAQQLGISRTEAGAYVEAYFERYPGVRRYMDETRVLAAEKGYVETLFGRRLYLPDINAGNQMMRKAAERTAINAPMQGTAADIIKRAMVDVQAWLDSSAMDAHMIMQVHDELVFEVPESQLEAFKAGVALRMQHAADLDVPLVVDIGVGDNWDEAH